MASIVGLNKIDLVDYTLHLADNSMILGQRLAEWCGHGPVLEQDIAMTNIALDLIGEARSLYQYAAEQDVNGPKTEDDYPSKRDVLQWRNILLVELPNDDFAYTIVRQCLFDIFHFHYLDKLKESHDQRLKAIAAKSIKEAKYHLKYSSEWMIRLGDGTAESHERMQTALDNRIMYFEEAFIPTELERKMAELGVAPDLAKLYPNSIEMLRHICEKATLTIPEVKRPQTGGKTGIHTEHLGFILTELQFMQKTYPNSQW